MLFGEVFRGLRRTPFIILSILFPAAVPSGLQAANVTLAWDPSVGPGVVAYNVYVGGRSMTYTNVISSGSSTNLTVSNLVAGATYYFAATAVNGSGLESDFSNELQYTVPTGPTQNVPPTLALIGNVTVAEGSGVRTVPLGGISSGSASENQTLIVTASSSDTDVIPTPAVNYTSPNSTGSLSFTPVPFAYGSAQITVTVNDGQSANNTISRQFTVNVTPVNQPPTLNTLGNLVLNEGAGQQLVELAGITSGAANEFDVLRVTATSSNPNLIPTPTVSYTSPSTTGILTFTPVAYASGTATITVTVNDGGAQSATVSRSFSVTVNSVNQAPTLAGLANLTINEGSGAVTVNLSGITSGAANEADTLTVSASSSNPGLIPNPTVTYRSPNATGSLTFAPVPFGFGSATVTVTVNDGQSQNNTFSRSFVVTVSPVNQAPTLDPIANLKLDKNAPVQTVALTGITTGATNEVQVLTVSASSSNPGLVPNPVVSYASPGTSGSLAFTPVADAAGAATITVTVSDGGDQNSTVSRTFVVYVDQGNLPPTLNPLADFVVPSGAGLQIVSLTGISAGAPGEFDTVTVTAVSSAPTIIPHPLVSYISPGDVGSLTFTPVTGAYGTATISVTASDGQPGNAPVVRTFKVTVDATPMISQIPDQQMQQGGAPVTVPFTISDPDTSSGSLVVSAVSSLSSLLPAQNIVFGGSEENRTVTLTPAPGQVGSADVVVTVTDGRSSAASKFQFTVAGTGSTGNAPPAISSISNQGTVENTATAPIPFTISDPDTAATSLLVSAQSSNPALLPVSNISIRGYGGSRTLVLTPIRGQKGSADVVVLVSDGKATASTMFRLEVHGATGVVTLNTHGKGRLVYYVKPEAMVLGKSYSVTAIPEMGQEFVGWSGSLSSTSPTLSFTVNSRMYLEANFAPSPFVAVQGTYNGLFHEAGKIRQFSSGSMKVTVTSRGTYTGQMQAGSRRYSFTGKLSRQLQATNVIQRPLMNPMVVELRLGSGGEADEFFGRVLDGAWTASIEGDRAVFNARTNAAPWAGSYTFVLPGQTDGNPAYPAGNGYGTMKVSANGLTTVSGTLADGTKLSLSAYVSRNGALPVYASLYAGNGSVFSWLNFAARSADDLHGDLNWIKPANIYSRYYPGGFTAQCEAVGSAYRAPRVAGDRVLGLAVADVLFRGGNLSYGVDIEVNIDTYNRVLNVGKYPHTLTLSPSTGLFRGSVADPVTFRTLAYNGVVFQKMNAGFGMVLGTNQTSSVTIAR